MQSVKIVNRVKIVRNTNSKSKNDQWAKLTVISGPAKGKVHIGQVGYIKRVSAKKYGCVADL